MKAIKRFVVAAFMLSPLLLTFTSQSQTQTQPAQTPAPAVDEKSKEAAEEGIPVTNQLVIDRCSACHKKDEKGRLTRISF